MTRWKKTLVRPDDTIRKALETIDASLMQIALVVDADNILLGVVTDGDVRRGILKGLTLEDKVERVMNKKPLTATRLESKHAIVERLKKSGLRHMPVIDEKGRLVSLEHLGEILQEKDRDNCVILMAGGEGRRLGNLTSECPKPLLKVGGRPILEIILSNFLEYKLKKFFVSVNYKAEMIEEYFGNGSRWGAEIEYLRENQKLGTAGALSLLPVKPNEPFIVMNGDLLTKVNIKRLLEFHAEQKPMLTMCVREYDFQVPFGVVKLDHHRITAIDEKPQQKFFVNAGVYVIEPEALKMIPNGTHFDMTNLVEKLIEQKQEVAAFPITEYWLDIGHRSDFERANGDYIDEFKDSN